MEELAPSMLHYAGFVQVAEQTGGVVVVVDYQFVVVPGFGPPALRVHVLLRLPVFYVRQVWLLRVLEVEQARVGLRTVQY